MSGICVARSFLFRTCTGIADVLSGLLNTYGVNSDEWRADSIIMKNLIIHCALLQFFHALAVKVLHFQVQQADFDHVANAH
jgi:hypothetical protein